MELIGTTIMMLAGLMLILILIFIIVLIPVVIIGSLLDALAPEAFDSFLNRLGKTIENKLRGE